MPHLHVALVTERPEASLIPVLQLRPQEVELVPYRSTQLDVERLAILLRHELPAGTDIHVHADMPSSAPQRTGEYFDALAEALQRRQFDEPNLSITYDPGNCDIPTALLLQQAMRRCDADWLYVDERANALYRMASGSPSSNPEVLAIEPVLDIDRYLQANGRKRVRALSDGTEWQRTCERRRSLTHYLAQHADRLAGLLGELNDIVHGPGGVLERRAQHAPVLRQGASRQRLHRPPQFPATDALTKLHEAGLLRWTSAQPLEVEVATLEGALYLGGSWLAEYAWHSAREAGLSQVCCGTHILDLDVDRNDQPVIPACLAVENNRLLFLESLIARPGPQACLQQGLQRLHELLNHSAGLAATRLLLACGEFDRAQRRLTELQRAQGPRVEVVESGDLKHLPALLAHWKEHGRWPGS
ncbi:Card1-like endonuclease domain-containing protein [Billgrantia saliphila]|uniref:Card1-like endonuclease domain-containing protein n=1 Tax=Billgrantia saliphila TaxID=1848458 RepID=UPI000CE36703|nr:DUF1887 family CARF protein [Halomonas saliphila]